MQLERKCKQCGTHLSDDKKLGAQYCNHACSQGYYKRRRRILDQINKLEGDIKFNENWIGELANQSIELDKNIVDLSPLTQNLTSAVKKLETLDLLINSSPQNFRKLLATYLDRNMEKFSDDYSYLKYGDLNEQGEVLERHRNRFRRIQKDVKEKVSQLKNDLEIAEGGNQSIGLEKVGFFMKQSDIRSEIDDLNEKLGELKAINLDQLPPKFNPKKSSLSKPKLKPVIKGVSGKEILEMTFDNLKLDGELGRFFGLLQRKKCAIAMTGDSGAGKTTFSFQLAKAFMDVQQSVAYFSLESGITETTQELIEGLDLTGSKFEVFGEGDLEDVRLQAEHFDCVIVDSYAKISSKADDFEALRQDFPSTFFIIIFQKTTDGKIRGGSSILYNSTSTIDIRLTKGNHRIAFMQKSRYGTENFAYSISLDLLLKDWKSPIKWSEIEERWPSPHRH